MRVIIDKIRKKEIYITYFIYLFRGGRLCSIAFNNCCGHSKNGCISSHPIDIKYL